MSEALKLTQANFLRFQNEIKNHTIKGLPKGSIAFLISPPDTGKGYLSLSIAYSGALESPLIPHLTDGKRIKTLYWPVEDGVALVFNRIERHAEALGDTLFASILNDVAIYSESAPLAKKDKGYLYPSEEHISSLISAAKDFDLLIIDTLREAFGPAHEVDDDFFIKTTLQRIAKEADVAILAVHHPTKAVSRGQEGVTSVSGSGLSSTLANARLHLYLDTHKQKNSSQPVLRYIKANLLSKADRQDIELCWGEGGLLHEANYTEIAAAISAQAPKPKARSAKSKQPLEEREPITLDFSDSVESGDYQGDVDATDFFDSIDKKIK